MHSSQITIDEQQEYKAKTEELNTRIFKLIQTFLRKLDSQVFLDQIYTTHGNEDADEEERGGKVKTSSPEDLGNLRNAAESRNKVARNL